jgi:hypothetical protein
VQQAENRVVLEASPLHAGGAAAPSVGVTTGERGTSVTVTHRDRGAGDRVTGFVLDARAVEEVPRRLELEWRALPQPFLLEVNVEQSADLDVWRSVGRGSIAALSIGGTEVRHAEVPVRASAGGYFRITPSGSVADWHLVRATLVSLTSETAPTLDVRVAPLSALESPDDGPVGALYFDTGGVLPAASVSLGFGGDTGWARADVAASRSLGGPWQPVAFAQLFYEMSLEGRELASAPVSLGRHEARYWRVVPAAPLPGTRLEWTVHFPVEHLRVAARGRAPYLLAAGTLAEEAGPDVTFGSVWSQLDVPAESVPSAALGPRRELGGDAALVPPRVFPWRSAALWAVLIAGALVVAAMAVRLAREMRSPAR